MVVIFHQFSLMWNLLIPLSMVFSHELLSLCESCQLVLGRVSLSLGSHHDKMNESSVNKYHQGHEEVNKLKVTTPGKIKEMFHSV